MPRSDTIGSGGSAPYVTARGRALRRGRFLLASVNRCHARIPEEDSMEINWRHDIDQVLEDARTQRKPVLLDFSAAPM
jgi:hypothetical protein